jgi:hypothetical protein
MLDVQHADLPRQNRPRNLAGSGNKPRRVGSIGRLRRHARFVLNFVKDLK